MVAGHQGMGFAHGGFRFVHIVALGQREQFANPLPQGISRPGATGRNAVVQRLVRRRRGGVGPQHEAGFLEGGTVGGLSFAAQCGLGQLVSHFVQEDVADVVPRVGNRQTAAQADFPF